MKRAEALGILCLLVVGCGGDDEPSERRLIIFHTNDEHSHLFGHGPEIDDYPVPTTPGDGTIVGNIARRAEVLNAERAAASEAGIDTLTVSAGDETQGTLVQEAFQTTSPDLALMAQLGYDVMCPGNHEFDLGPDAFANAITAAMQNGGVPQYVSTNINFDDSDPLDDPLAALYGEGDSNAAIKRYHVVETASGIRVGFLGVLGAEAALVAPNKAPVTFSGDPADEGNAAKVLPALYDDLQPTIDALRNNEQVDVVILLSHSGIGDFQPSDGDEYKIAQNVTGIDLLVGGHSHTALQEPVMVEAPDGYVVPIVQAGSYSAWLGRVEMVVPEGERPQIDLDSTKTKLIPIDDTIVPTDTDLLGELDSIIADIERDSLPSKIEAIEGQAVTDDTSVIGDLYYRTLCNTSFDVVGLRPSAETNMLNLSTDAMLATAESLEGTTLLAVQAAGSIRADIKAGKTGAMSVADLYRVVPLGENPVDGSIGTPLTRFYITTAEIKAALEIGVSRGLISDSLFLSGSGFHFEYDPSRPAQDISNIALALDPQNGRVTKIEVDVDHNDGVDNPTVVLFDINRTGQEWTSSLGTALSIQPVVTTYYIASLAEVAGVTLKDENGATVAIDDTILRRGDGSDVKDHEAFMSYIRDECMANGGNLPSRYDESTTEGTVPRRITCMGSACP